MEVGREGGTKEDRLGMERGKGGKEGKKGGREGGREG